MWLLDSNILIKCNKLDPRPFVKENTFTTIFCIIEFPLAVKFDDISIIYPSPNHYEQGLLYALALRKAGRPIPTIDILIGTITVDKNLILVSEDNHFKLFQEVEPRLKLITLEMFLKKDN